MHQKTSRASHADRRGPGDQPRQPSPRRASPRPDRGPQSPETPTPGYRASPPCDRPREPPTGRSLGLATALTADHATRGGPRPRGRVPWTAGLVAAQPRGSGRRSRAGPSLAAAPVNARLDAGPDAGGGALVLRRQGAAPVAPDPARRRTPRFASRTGRPSPLSLHWHGVRGPNAMDGVGGLTQAPIAPGRGLRLPLHAARCRHLPDPPLRARRRAPSRRSAASPASLVVEEPTPPSGRPRRPPPGGRLAADGGGRARALRHEPGAGSGPSGRLGNWLTVNGRPLPRRDRGPAGRRASACASPTPATPGSCASASTG